jgi:hypothetical protein
MTVALPNFWESLEEVTQPSLSLVVLTFTIAIIERSLILPLYATEEFFLYGKCQIKHILNRLLLN